MARTRRAKKQKRERASARRRAEEHSTGFDRTAYRIPDGMSMFVPKAGKYNIDVLEFPVGKGNPWADEGTYHYERTFHIHRAVGADESSYCCPTKVQGRACPICEARTKEAKQPDCDDEIVKALRPKERQLFLVYVHEESDKGLQLFEISHYAFGERLDVEIRESDEEDGYDAFASHDTDEGMTLRVSFKDETFPGGGKPFPKVETIGFRQRRQDIPQQVLDQVVCLDDLLIVPEYDKLKSIFLQLDGQDEDEEEDEKPKRSRRTRPKKSDYEEEIEDDEPEDEDEDDDEPWDSEDEEEEEEEEKPKPKPKRGRPKKQPEPVAEEDEDEDDEDWFDDDDEEEEPEPEPEKPKRRRRAAAK